MPVCALATSPSAACSSLRMIFSTSSPTYPASVNVVASTMAKGTSSILARVWASSVASRPVHLDALVVVVDSYRQFLLRLFLTDDVLVEETLDLLRFGQVGRGSSGLGLAPVVFEDGVANRNAFITDVCPRVIAR